MPRRPRCNPWQEDLTLEIPAPEGVYGAARAVNGGGFDPGRDEIDIWEAAVRGLISDDTDFKRDDD